MSEQVKDFILKTAADKGSRKFLLTVAFGFVVVANEVNDWGLTLQELGVIFGAMVIYFLANIREHKE